MVLLRMQSTIRILVIAENNLFSERAVNKTKFLCEYSFIHDGSPISFWMRINLLEWMCSFTFLQRLFSVVFVLIREDTVYPNFAYWENCEFYPTFAYMETLVF